MSNCTDCGAREGKAHAVGCRERERRIAETIKMYEARIAELEFEREGKPDLNALMIKHGIQVDLTNGSWAAVYWPDPLTGDPLVVTGVTPEEAVVTLAKALEGE